MLEVGRICLKTAGREAGSYCVVLKKVDKEFVLVTGPRAVTSVRRRRCSSSKATMNAALTMRCAPWSAAPV